VACFIHVCLLGFPVAAVFLSKELPAKSVYGKMVDSTFEREKPSGADKIVSRYSALRPTFHDQFE